MAFEKLYLALVPFRRIQSLKCSKVPAFAGLWTPFA